MKVLSLFDESANMVRPWAEDGAICYCVDIVNEVRTEHVGLGPIHFLDLDLTNQGIFNLFKFMNPDIIFGFPPCTDLAVSGAAHFESKRQKNPKFHEDAVKLARVTEKIGQKLNKPWMVENPVSVLSSMWRKPDHYFHPYEYGGYLPENDVHPRWPEYISPRDQYRKKTCLWTGNGFKMPIRIPLSDPQSDSAQHRKLGGKSAKTKQIRSETPRGFALAVKEANYEG